MLISSIIYSIFTNVTFTLGYIAPEQAPVYAVPKMFLRNFLVAFALALGVNLVVLPVTSRTLFLVLVFHVISLRKKSFEGFVNRASQLLKVYDEFINPPFTVETKPLHQSTLKQAKDSLRVGFLKLMSNKSDAKKEIAIGALSVNDISKLSRLAKNVTWPLLGVGTLAVALSETSTESSGPLGLNLTDLNRALDVIHDRCGKLNFLCREALEHILCGLEMGKYAPPSILARILRKRAVHGDAEMAVDIGTDGFLARFDLGINAFRGHRSEHLSLFYDDENKVPQRILFFVLFVEFLLVSVADEIRELVVFSDEIRTTGILRRRRLILPQLKVFRKGVLTFFQKPEPENTRGEYGTGDSDVFTEWYADRVHRKPFQRTIC
jgi:Putative ER transporter, 6TM, N-terminal